MSRISKNPLYPMRLLPLVGVLAAALAQGTQASPPADGWPSTRIAQRYPVFNARGFTAPGRMHRPPTVRVRGPGRSQGGIVVSNCDDSGAGSLRDAVASAATGDTIDLTQLSCSTITLGSGAIATALDDLTIQGPGQVALAIDGNHADRVFSHSGAGTLVIDGVTVTHGSFEAPDGDSNGGCVYSMGHVVLDHVTVSECTVSSTSNSAYGAGVFAYGATLISSTVAGNTSQGGKHALGGGVIGLAGISVTGSTITGNSAVAIAAESLPAGEFVDASMGALGSYYDIEIADSVISGNTVTATTDSIDHGVAANEAGIMSFSTLTVVRSTISDNAAQATHTGSGEGAYTYAFSVGGGARASSLVISDSTISGNTTSATASNTLYAGYEYALGGGLMTRYSTGTVSLTNSTISGNSVSRSQSALYAGGAANGGGVFSDAASMDLLNTTVTANTADQGSGVYQSPTSAITLDSTIVGGNVSAAGGSDFGARLAMTIAGANNLIASASATLTLPADTLAADPLLGPLDDNGGPTATHALLEGSPAIDAGSNVAALAFDQRGTGHVREYGDQADIGAFELQLLTDPIFSDGFEP